MHMLPSTYRIFQRKCFKQWMIKNVSTWKPVSNIVINLPLSLSQWTSGWALRRRPCWNAWPTTLPSSGGNHNPICAAMSGAGLPSKWCMACITVAGSPKFHISGSEPSVHSGRMATGWIFTGISNNGVPNNNTCWYLKIPKTNQGKKWLPPHKNNQRLEAFTNNEHISTRETTIIN